MTVNLGTGRAVYWRMDWEDEDPGLPIKLGPCSNGEYDPEPLPPVLTETIRLAREACERNARRVGMSRREFMLSICGAATTLMVLDACARGAFRADGSPRSTGPGGHFRLAPEDAFEPEAAHEAIGGEEFVFDMQGHLLEYDLNPIAHGQDFWTPFPQQFCGESDPRTCFSMENFMTEMFLRSDTTMLSLSALPIYPEGSPLSLEIMDETRKMAEILCRDERVLLHGQALPNVGHLEANLNAMEAVAGRFPIVAWKTFTHFPDLYEHNGNGWWLDDHERGVPQVGEAFIRRAIDVGVPIICVHKGLSRGSRFASPADIGPAAKRHPHARFVVYHSGFEARGYEGPYTYATADIGINRLITSLKKSGIGPNENVYAELGSTWWYVMRTPTTAAHVLGKLLKYVGEDNVVWGTDCIFYGSPQDQIQAFRAFHISDEFQERYGYPKLTKAIKSKVLGLNAARLYGVEPITTKARFSRRELEKIRRALPLPNRTYGQENQRQTRAFLAYHQGAP
jgi:predicted TIM-barrel fold metal-dependent hydrolase